MSPQPRLLAIVELGGYPDFSALYREAGYEVRVCPTLRQALPLIRDWQPHTVVSEFRYGPTYGSQLGNLETLIAALQKQGNPPRLILFSEREHLEHTKHFEDRYVLHAVLPYPVDRTLLRQALSPK